MAVTLIVGGTSVIGQAMVERLANTKDVLVFTYHTNEALAKRLARDLQDKGLMVYALPLDATNPDDVSAFFASIAPYGKLSQVICTVGKSHYGLFSQSDNEVWQALWTINVSSYVYVTREAIKLMQRTFTKGSILLLSSIWGERGASNEVLYSMTKGAINSLVKALAKEVSYQGIRINALAPGAVDTPMLDELGEDKQVLLEAMPFGTFVSSEELAHMAQTILTTPSLTGQIITVDGGYTS